MKNIPSALKAHYKSRFTTTCTMWHITMTSGDELFFTDHDKDIIYEEELYVSAAGFSTTALESHSDLSVDNINIESFVSDQSGINVGTEEGFFVSSRVERFVPKFWTVDGPRSANFCLTTAGRSARVDFTSRLDNDLVGLIWASEDTHDHRMLAYATNRDYRGCVLDFDLTVGGSAPAINDVTKALALTINGRDAAGVTTQWIIPLFRYMNPNDITTAHYSGHVTLNFDALGSGFNADVPVYTGDIDNFFISCITSGWFVGSTGTALSGNQTAFLQLDNVTATGGNSTIIANQGVVPAHSLGMCTSYDDHYNQSPERILANTYALGYRTDINHYCGMSVFPEKKWNSTLGQLQVVNTPGGDTTDPISLSARVWHANFLSIAHSYGYNVTYSVSFETYSVYTNTDWVQRDWEGRFGFTGYSPPSYLFSPCNTQGMQYLKACFLSIANVMYSVGAGPNGKRQIQIGEPWWWVQTDNNHPCIYDNATRTAFNAATGLFMASVGDVFSANPNSPAINASMTTFVRNALGQACQDIRTYLRGTYSDVWVSLLPFLPTIESCDFERAINRPDSYYAYPNFDFFQTEAYDWIIFNQMDKVPFAITYPRDTLGYPTNRIQYLAGFVPDLTSSGTSSIPPGFDPSVGPKTLWKRIFTNTHDFEADAIWKQLVWAYTIVMRDSITYREKGSIRAFYYRGKYVQVYPPRSIGGISQDDLRSGRLDYADVEIFEVNYNDLTMGKNTLRTGKLGEISAGTLSLQVELRGLTQQLTRKIIRLTSKTCMADLGDPSAR
jgi:hypothetical protein